MTERKVFALTPKMARAIEDLAFEHRVRSDSAVIRAAIEVALEHKDELKMRIEETLADAKERTS